MDNLTHSLVAVAISRLGFKDRVAYATTGCVIAANLPDIDLLWSFHGVRYLEWHRGWTHSLWALPLWALLTAGALVWAERRKRRRALGNRPQQLPPPAPGRRLWLIGLVLGFVAAGSHLLLDWTNSYGIRLFAPAQHAWYALDWEPIIDPALWAILLSFLLLPMLLSLVRSEVGAQKTRHRLSAGLALLAVAGWWGLRGVEHQRALDVLANPLPEYEGAGVPRQAAAIPTFSPFSWLGVANFADRYVTLTVDSARGDVDRDQAYRLSYKPQPSPLLTRVEGLPEVAGFLRFARFPLFIVQSEGASPSVRVTDLRFDDPGAPRRMGLQIDLTPQYAVESERFSWGHFGPQH